LKNQVPVDWVQGRIVLIGVAAPSIDNFFYTPFDSNRLTPGVILQANLASQIVGAALGERPLIQTLPKSLEWLWLTAWAGLGAVVSRTLLQTNRLSKAFSAYTLIGAMGICGASLILISYSIFLTGTWITTIAPLSALLLSSMVSAVYYNQKLRELVCFDGLTQVANRRCFDQFLDRKLAEGRELSLIFCDVDYFKRYNDTYGHQEGDQCLKQVAEAIRLATRRADLVARYGGEEFAVVLPYTDAQTALQIAERITAQVRSRRIVHSGSLINSNVTLSLGIASITDSTQTSAATLLMMADQALYQAKAKGRDCIVVAEPR
jgi:adenylate cyclase